MKWEKINTKRPYWIAYRGCSSARVQRASRQFWQYQTYSLGGQTVVGGRTTSRKGAMLLAEAVLVLEQQ